MGRGRFLVVAIMAVTFVCLFLGYRFRQVAEQARLQYRPSVENQYQWKHKHPKDINAQPDGLHNSTVATVLTDGDGELKANGTGIKAVSGAQRLPIAQNKSGHLDSHQTYTYEQILLEEHEALEAGHHELDIIQEKQNRLAQEKSLAASVKLKQELAATNSTWEELQKRKQEFEEQMRQNELSLFEERRELEAERRRLEEDKERFEEQLHRLRELSHVGKASSTEAPHVPPEYWEGLTWTGVHSQFPGILLLQDYKPRNFFGEARTTGKKKAAELALLLDVQAEDRFYSLVTIPHIACQQIQRMGNEGDGGWDLCVAQPYTPEKNNCIVYSFGINNDFSFDDDVAEQFGCEVDSFDPSMSVGDHLHAPKVHFYQLGLGAANTVNDDGWKLVRLRDIMAKLGHQEQAIDVLKMDIEFNEWKCLLGMLEEGSLHNVKQLIFEIHTPEVYIVGQPSTKVDYLDMHSTLFKLEQQGFRRFHYHFNPYGKFTSIRSGKVRTCCYELYYLNIKFLKSEQKKSS